MSFDLKTTMDRDGGWCKCGSDDARIICTDRKSHNGHSIGILIETGGTEYLRYRDLQGCANDCDPLVTLPETKVKYANVYNDCCLGAARNSIENCVQAVGYEYSTCIGILKITTTGDDWDVEKVKL